MTTTLNPHMPPLTLEQAVALQLGQVVYHRYLTNADGTPQVWRVNGKVKTWKTRPNNIRVPLARGMYQKYALYPHNLCDFSLTSVEDTHIDGDEYFATGIEAASGQRKCFAESRLADFPDRVAKQSSGSGGTFTKIFVWRRRNGRRSLIRHYA